MRRILLAAALVVTVMTGVAAADVTEIWRIEEPVGILALDDGSMFEVVDETFVLVSQEPVATASNDWVALVYDEGHAGSPVDTGDFQLIAFVRTPTSEVIEAY